MDKPGLYALIISEPGYACIQAIRLKKSWSNNPYIQMRNHPEEISRKGYDGFALSRIGELVRWDQGMATYAPTEYKSLFLNDAIKKCEAALKMLEAGPTDIYGEMVTARMGLYRNKILELREERIKNKRNDKSLVAFQYYSPN